MDHFGRSRVYPDVGGQQRTDQDARDKRAMDAVLCETALSANRRVLQESEGSPRAAEEMTMGGRRAGSNTADDDADGRFGVVTAHDDEGRAKIDTGFGVLDERRRQTVSIAPFGLAMLQRYRVFFAFMQSSSADEVISLPLLMERLPMPPPASLDPVLDATVECLSRHGLSKSSLSDIAREMGVAPSTVYRKVGSVENAALLVVARDAQRLLDRMPEVMAGIEGPRAVTAFLAEAIESFANHPLAAKMLRDEVDWVGRLVTRRLDALVAQAAEISAPLLEAAMAAGNIRRQDPLALAHWIVRIGMVSIMAPPPGDLRVALDALLLPVLEPVSTGRKR